MNPSLRHHADLGFRGPNHEPTGTLVTIRGTITRIFPDRIVHDGAEHQHLDVNITHVVDGPHGITGPTFVAIRITNGGIGHDVLFVVRTPVEMKGLFIRATDAIPGEDNPAPPLPVLHFTHHPIGYVLYEGVKYDGASTGSC